jgi:transcription elongation GreA/GreB family factor
MERSKAYKAGLRRLHEELTHIKETTQPLTIEEIQRARNISIIDEFFDYLKKAKTQESKEVPPASLSEVT